MYNSNHHIDGRVSANVENSTGSKGRKFVRRPKNSQSAIGENLAVIKERESNSASKKYSMFIKNKQLIENYGSHLPPNSSRIPVS